MSRRDIDSGALQVLVDDRPQYGSRVRHNHECLAHQILRTDALRGARRWSPGKTTIKGSLTRTRYASSGIPLSRRRNAASIFPFDRPSASSGELLASSSRKIRKASGIHFSSCPVKNPIVKHGLLG